MFGLQRWRYGVLKKVTLHCICSNAFTWVFGKNHWGCRVIVVLLRVHPQECRLTYQHHSILIACILIVLDVKHMLQSSNVGLFDYM